MESTHSVPIDDKVRREAADWFARLRSPEKTQADVLCFEAWLNANPAHRQALDALDELWFLTGRLLRESRCNSRPELPASNPKATVRQPYRFRVGPAKWLLAASVLLALTIALMQSLPERTHGRQYQTALGEQRVIRLDDGTRITLDTSTLLKVEYSDKQRRVALLKGQAGFDVAKDRARPFRVQAGAGTVEALGTSFDIYKTDTAVKVTLLEGSIEVRAPRAAAAVRMQAGSQIAIDTDGALSTVAEADMKRATAWRNGKLAFKDTPLSEAVTEANRYSNLSILLSAPYLKDLRISGTFEAGNSEDFVKAVKFYFGLRSQVIADKQILLLPPEGEGAGEGGSSNP